MPWATHFSGKIAATCCNQLGMSPEGEVNARDELQHQGRRDDDGTDRSSRAERRIGNAENGAPETAEEEDPGQSQPATGVGGQLDIVEEARDEEQGDELRDRGGENESDLAEEVGHRRHRVPRSRLSVPSSRSTVTDIAIVWKLVSATPAAISPGRKSRPAFMPAALSAALNWPPKIVENMTSSRIGKRKLKKTASFARVHLQFEQGAFPSHASAFIRPPPRGRAGRECIGVDVWSDELEVDVLEAGGSPAGRAPPRRTGPTAGPPPRWVPPSGGYAGCPPPPTRWSPPRCRGHRVPSGCRGEELAAGDDSDAVSERLGLIEIVRRQHDRRALVGEAADELPEVATSLRVEAGRRLVEEEQFWPADDAQADVDAPLLAAGEPAIRASAFSSRPTA